ncbi:glycosyltransferase family 2 protein [Kocuria sp.]|uniref:glycosyltransferase family 2 protein n=1 Tax=Kocuria sp. TaxID=1871328 RepID=UPI0026E00171|nr:glycosyltransferase family A protein [Kocuria sp.]MDO5619722.1 glycosyltransferase family A protein [Kocuria sp.]
MTSTQSGELEAQSQNLPRVAITVPSRGGADHLPRLLQALAHQQNAPAFQVHVVLDGDIDNSESVLGQQAQKWPELDLSWTVFPENRGRVAALNHAAQATTGTILVRCDDDLEPGPDYVRAHAQAHAHGEPRGVVGLYLNRYPDTHYARAYGRTADVKFRSEAYDSTAATRWRYWAGNVSVPRQVFDQLGGYESAYRRYGWEDVDFGYRLHAAGFPVVVLPELETPHYVAATTTQVRTARALHSGAARDTFTRIHGEQAHPLRLPRGLWGRAVRVGAAVLNVRTLDAVSRCVDRALPILPPWIGTKSVAFLVESAGLAGSLHPERARETF